MPNNCAMCKKETSFLQEYREVIGVHQIHHQNGPDEWIPTITPVVDLCYPCFKEAVKKEILANQK
jgi:hypothetical protein